jgi:hypothetical protein
MESIKKAQVSKDIDRLKSEEARDLGVQDFFNSRDRTNRKTKGLVDDTSEILSREIDSKEKLYEESLKVDKLPEGIKAMFGGVFTTAKRNKISEDGIYLPTASYGKGSDTDMDVDFSVNQTVLSVGPHAQQVEEGMEVVLNMDNFKKRLESTMAQKIGKEFEFILPIEIIDEKEYLYVSERDIKYIVNNKK